jgi:hypothetical protein
MEDPDRHSDRAGFPIKKAGARGPGLFARQQLATAALVATLVPTTLVAALIAALIAALVPTTLVAALVATLATLVSAAVTAAGSLAALAAGFPGFFGRELVGRALLVRGAPAFTGDLALLVRVHRGKAAVRRTALIAALVAALVAALIAALVTALVAALIALVVRCHLFLLGRGFNFVADPAPATWRN